MTAARIRAGAERAAIMVGIGWLLCAPCNAVADVTHPSRAGADLVILMRPGASPWALPGVTAARSLNAALHAWEVSVQAKPSTSSWGAAGALAIQANRSFRRSAETTSCTGAPASPDYLLQTVDAIGVPAPPTTPPIAILDSGVDTSQPLFAGRIRSPTNVVSHNADVTDLDGHGTAVAGVAVAGTGNDQGVSPSSPIIPIKMFAADGTATAADVVAAIGAAIQDGAGVINLSAAGPLSGVAAADNQAVARAIDVAFSKGILVVSASGNEGGAAPDVPAADPHVISVGAIGASGERATFSNYGLTLDLVAPGVQLTEPAPASVCASGYQLVDGTSFAAPAVSAAAALLEATRPELSASQRFEMLRTSARPLSLGGWNVFTGFGALDVASALRRPAPANDPGEVDDDVYWVTGAHAAAHPPLLTQRRLRGFITANVERSKDPADVYRIVLKRGEKVQLALSTAAGVQLRLAVWAPATGPFEVGVGKRRHRLRARVVSVNGTLTYTAVRRGTYFVSVEAMRTLSGGSGYTLTARGR